MARRLRVIAGVGLLMAATACGTTTPAGRSVAAPSTNVSGVLARGPTPTCPADEPCDPPARAATVVFTASTGAQTRVSTTGDGAFAVHLDPGQYSITVAPPPFSGRVVPSSVTVPATGSVFLSLRIARSP